MKIKKKYLRYASATLVAVAMFSFFFLLCAKGVSNLDVPLNTGWTICANGKTYENVDVSTFQLPEENKTLDTIVLKHVLSDTIFEHPVLRFELRHARVNVYTDKLIYSYGERQELPINLIGAGYHHAYFNPDVRQDSIRIEIVPAKENAFNIPTSFVLLPAEVSNSDFVTRHFFALMVGLFLVMFGIIAVLVCISFTPTGSGNGNRFAMIGIISFLIGIWTLCCSRVIQIFSMDFNFNSTLECVSIYLVPLPFTSLLVFMRRKMLSAWKLNLLYAIFYAGFVFLVVATVGHVCYNRHFADFIWLFQIYFLTSLVFVLIFIVPYRRILDSSDRILSYGVIIFSVFFLFDAVRYDLVEFQIVKGPFWNITWIPLGALIFVVLLSAGYVAYLYKIMAGRAEREALAAIAYVDSLTGLFNRTKSLQIFEVLDRNSSDYAMVCIDMNGLKYVNDRYGHGTGDKLLKTFAGMFKQAFTGVGTTIRLGGDEFLAIIRLEHFNGIEDALKSMLEMQKNYRGDLPVPIEVAYGVATRFECSAAKGTFASPDDVYRAADEKMYAMKQNMKSDLIRR
ncbi:MAG: GGDEF domain-containing protein [Fibrobacter sp.]|nr:GGDEF domain-containing protein [Fibrobacter sp.]